MSARPGRAAPTWVVAPTWAAAAAVAAAAATSPACSVDRRTPDDTLVVLIEDTIRDVDPRYALSSHDTKLSRLVAPGLTSIDQPSLEPRMELATSIEEVAPLVWEATLRPDARFSDGAPVTADDVAFTFQSAMDPAMNSLHGKGFSERFHRVEAVDARRVRFYLATPVATLLSDLDFGIIERAAATDGGRFPGGVVVGAGPYMLASIEPERVHLARNPHYHGAAPPVPKLDVRTVRDASARALMLVGGSADFAQNALRPDLVDPISRRSRLRVATGQSAILSYLMMQNEDPALSDVRVRHAIAYAVDADRIVAKKFAGRAVLATGMLPPGHWAYNGDVPRYPHDPDRARALLDEAGFPDPDGPGGAPRLRLSYKTSTDQFRIAVARTIAAQLGQVGIEVDVRSFEFGTFFADIKKGNFQLASMQTGAITEPNYLYTFFHSSRIPTPEEINVHNRWRYRNARVDELTTAGRQEMDRDRRLAMYLEVQAILARDLPIIPLWHEDNIAIMNRSVTGYLLLPSARFAGLATATKQ